jgi:HrpA-like RNA helicase
LDSIGSPILCTQPRRLAVVAVATYVAKQRVEARLGKEVGYHVGQDKMANHETGLLFATAGILLEELKGQGLHALTKYKVVIIDECHERSCESELVLTIIKQFMIANPRSNLRLVLMSATFNHNLYTSFFHGVPGCEYVDTITLQTAESIDAFYSKVQTHYLEDISRMLASSVAEHTADYMTYCNAMKCDPMVELDGSGGGKALSHQLLLCIMSLVNHLHCDESPDSIFLVFAPTYRKSLTIDCCLQKFHCI